MKMICIIVCALGLVLGCSLEDQAKTGSFVSDIIKKVRAKRISRSSTDIEGTSGNAPQNTSDTKTSKEQIYDKLKNELEQYSKAFRTAQFRFRRGRYYFQMPFFEKFPKFSGWEEKDIVYDTLGYDVDLIAKLETIVRAITPATAPTYFPTRPATIVAKLLDILYNTTYYMREVVVDHLNDVSLEQLGSIKSAEELTKIYNAFKELSALRTNAMSQIKIAIDESEPLWRDRVIMTNKLKKITDDESLVQDLKLKIIMKGLEIKYYAQLSKGV